MPELPEIATMVKALKSRIIGRVVTHSVFEESGLLDGGSPEQARKAILGREIVDVARCGKYVRIDFAGTIGGDILDLIEPRRKGGARKMKPKAAPLPPDASLVVRRPATLADALVLADGDDWIHGAAIDALRTTEKRGHGAPLTAPARQRLLAARRRQFGRYASGERSSLLVHLKMTGRWYLMNDNGQMLPPRTRFAIMLTFEDENLVLGMKDVRRLGTARVLTGAAAHAWPADLELGPDALTTRWTGNTLKKRVSGSLPIKLALLDQSRLAGVGNIYASEALHRAAIHPARPADSLTNEEWQRLAVTIPDLLRHSIRNWCHLSRWVGPSVEGYGNFNGELGVYDRRGESCRRCKGIIHSMVQGARTTFYCPGCQA
ncbi:MAG TPA: DNA-formamidopyrimidine glycosylase family protein [Candidatus Eisenbacteria bacterium]